ncbi:MAG: HIT domain-containing protein [Deltaproteobacteria bacterium]|nr:HIT domain-containing protein [Deltaproteobacteria bacterium]
MKVLWAPWRMEFILAKKTKACIFCRILKEKKDRKNLILARKKHCFVVLNKFPYNNGHLMVIPYRHTATLSHLSAAEKLEMMEALAEATDNLKKKLKPEGFNAGLNLGRVAGAGIKDHLHFHLVPRWGADTNFMPLFGETKAIPEHLSKSYDHLATAWRRHPAWRKRK